MGISALKSRQEISPFTDAIRSRISNRLPSTRALVIRCNVLLSITECASRAPHMLCLGQNSSQVAFSQIAVAAVELLRVYRFDWRWRRLGKLCSVNGHIWLNFAHFILRSPIRPDGGPLERHFNSADIAIIGVIDLSRIQANDGVGEH